MEWWRLYWDNGVKEVDRVTGTIYSADPGVDRHYLISISSYHTMKIHTLSFLMFCITRSVWDCMDPCKCVDPQCRVVSYLLTWFLPSKNQNCSFSWILFGCREWCGGMLRVGSLPSSSIVSPHWAFSSWCISNVSQSGMSRYSTNHARVPSVARFTVCTYIERLKWSMPYYDVVNLVTVTKTKCLVVM